MLVSDELREQYSNHLSQGFPDWTLHDFRQFLKAWHINQTYCKANIKIHAQDITRAVETKTEEQVEMYMNVFLQRYEGNS